MKKKMLIVLLVLVFSLTLATPAPALAQSSIFHVKETPSGSGDGSSWANACSLQYALTNAASGDEIWVAEGTYKPVKPTDDQDRGISFNLKGGVPLYGGYTANPLDPDERDPQLYETILSGDIGTEGIASDNSYHVVMSLDTNGAILDGFTITGGNANAAANPDNNGGGIYSSYSVLTVNNCTIYGNTAYWRGGGLFNSGGTVMLNWVTISQNTCTGTTGSWATGGGGIEVSGIGYPLTTVNLINSIVNGNTATAEGSSGGISRKGDGGGIRVGGGGTAVNITNSTIVNNEAEDEGGGIRAAGTSTIKNSILWGNTAATGAQFTGSPTISYSLVQGGYPAGKKVISDPPLFVNAYNDLHLQDDSPAIDAGKNSAVPAGITVDLDGNPRIVNRTVDMGAFEYLTAQQANTLDLIEQVGDLVDGEVLNPGQGNSLIVKLEAAFDQMYQQENTAIKQLEAFIKQVEDFVEMEILTEEQGKPLIDTANGIIEEL